MDGVSTVHDSSKKRRFLSSVDVFQTDCGDWIQQVTSGTPPLGVDGYSCAAVGDSLYYFGGYCGHYGCYHNTLHKLNTSSLQWILLPSASQKEAPMMKSGSGMVAFKDGEEDILYVVAGFGGPTPAYHRPEVVYDDDELLDDLFYCNEHHMFSLNSGELSEIVINVYAVYFHERGVMECLY